jgi:pyruvate-ferredoxin/flavodoxin oxidoreductase
VKARPLAQGYFVYDSRKAGAMTISHLRMSPRAIRSSSLIRQAGFLACHQFDFLDRYDVLEYAAPGGIFLLNAPHAADRVWDQLPVKLSRKPDAPSFPCHHAYASPATRDWAGINTIMHLFLALSGILPTSGDHRDQKTIQETYGKWGADTVQVNLAADQPRHLQSSSARTMSRRLAFAPLFR